MSTTPTPPAEQTSGTDRFGAPAQPFGDANPLGEWNRLTTALSAKLPRQLGNATDARRAIRKLR